MDFGRTRITHVANCGFLENREVVEMQVEVESGLSCGGCVARSALWKENSRHRLRDAGRVSRRPLCMRDSGLDVIIERGLTAASQYGRRLRPMASRS